MLIILIRNVHFFNPNNIILTLIIKFKTMLVLTILLCLLFIIVCQYVSVNGYPKVYIKYYILLNTLFYYY